MGLDIVEIVMRCEEVFGVEIPDADASRAITVGGLYELICGRLGLKPLARPEPGVGVACTLNCVPGLVRPLWTAENVWATLRALVEDQLGVRPEEVTYGARWVRDLGAD